MKLGLFSSISRVPQLLIRTKGPLKLLPVKSLTKNIVQFNQFYLNFASFTTKMAPYPGITDRYNFRKLSPEFIEKETVILIAEQRKAYDDIGACPLAEVTFDKIIKGLCDIMCNRSNKGTILDLPQHVASDKTLRDASSDAEKKLEEFDVEMSMRKDIFDRVVEFKERIGCDGLSPEHVRLVKKLIKMGKRNGLHLDQSKRDKIQTLKTRMSKLGITFQRNINEDNTKLYFTRDELAGMPDDFINELEKGEDDKLEVTLKYPHVVPINKRCQVSSTRKALVIANHSKCMKDNTPILEELVELRQKQADILGYKTHAAYILEECMAKTPEKVNDFLVDLSDKLQALWAKDKEDMIQLKKEECEKKGLEFSGELDFWDMSYYMNKVEEVKYAIDQNMLREYFPMEKVTKGLLDIYQTLLGLVFTEEKDADVWHDDVKLYRVNDAKSSELLGYFFLDLYPREGKYSHACVSNIQPSCIAPNNERQPAVCTLVCNFTKPTKEKPSLLEHYEVLTYFHEFGHAMHTICSKTDTCMFAGTSVEKDFLEAPSQMLENWVWEKEPLSLMAEHYKTKEPIPDECMEKLYKSRFANAGSLNLRQIVLSTFDQKIHTCDKADTESVYINTYYDIMGIKPIPNTNMPASFGHMGSHYDAQYYGYLWSEVFSMDMFESRFKKEGVLNPKVGADYREKILRPGSSKDGIDLIQDFLGRKPSNEAFLRSKGLDI